MEPAALVAEGADDVHDGEHDVDDRRGGVRDVGWDLGRARAAALRLTRRRPGRPGPAGSRRGRPASPASRVRRCAGRSLPARPGWCLWCSWRPHSVRRSHHARPRCPPVAPVTARAGPRVARGTRRADATDRVPAPIVRPARTSDSAGSGRFRAPGTRARPGGRTSAVRGATRCRLGRGFDAPADNAVCPNSKELLP